MSEHILNSHNKTLFLYHLVCPAKYRRKVFSDVVEKSLKEVCIEIGKRYEIHFVEIGSDEDHVHFLIQSVPMMQPTKMVRTIKSITATEAIIDSGADFTILPIEIAGILDIKLDLQTKETFHGAGSNPFTIYPSPLEIEHIVKTRWFQINSVEDESIFCRIAARNIIRTERIS